MKPLVKTTLKYLIEFLIVAFGVFLGIYVSELQSEKKLTTEKEKSLRFIIEELETNKSKLEQSFQYHQLIKVEIDSIAQVLSNEDLFLPYIGNGVFRHDRIKGWRGVNNANLDDTAFEAAKISGIIQEFDFKTIQRISGVYKFQYDYTEFGTSVLTKMVNLNSSSKVSDVFAGIELMAYDLRNYESSLIDAIESLQEELKTNP